MAVLIIKSLVVVRFTVIMNYSMVVFLLSKTHRATVSFERLKNIKKVRKFLVQFLTKDIVHILQEQYQDSPWIIDRD